MQRGLVACVSVFVLDFQAVNVDMKDPAKLFVFIYLGDMDP